MNNHNFTHGPHPGPHRKNEHFWPFGGPVVGASIIRLGPSWFTSML